VTAKRFHSFCEFQCAAAECPAGHIGTARSLKLIRICFFAPATLYAARVNYVAEHEDVTAIEALRMKQRLIENPGDPEPRKFFKVLDEYKASLKKR